MNYTDPSGHCFVLPPFDTAACAIAAGASISAGTAAAAGASVTALTVAIADAISPDFNPAADLVNLIGDAAEGAQQIGREIMKNLAGPSASGNPNDLDPQKPDKPSNTPKRSKPETKINAKGIEYPKHEVEGYGEVPFPKGNIKATDPTPMRAQFTTQYRIQFRNWWYDKYGWYPSPDKYDIHHIQPLSRGGTNDFSNLVPLERGSTHAQFTEWWLNYP